jgi:Holliday junction resolvase-like predicted endonuclease
MNVERELIISILNLTQNGCVSYELIKKDANIPSGLGRELHRKLQNEGFIYLRNHFVHTDSLQRLKLAVKAIQLGSDPEQVGGFLRWNEFEEMVAIVLMRNGYSVKRNMRFKHGGHRWEIDVIGCKKPIAVCVDCKRWRHGITPSALRKIVAEQAERTKALVESLPNPAVKMEFVTWQTVTFVPAVLSLRESRLKFYDEVPIIPVIQFQNFISQLPAYINEIKHFKKSLTNQLNNNS